MPSDYDPLAHVPDPHDPIQVFAYRHGAEILVEIRAKDAKNGLTVPWTEALRVAANINQQIFYALEGFVQQVNEGTIPEFDRLTDQWGPHGEGTAEQN